jgi:Na+/melibiose symporter-like transporter
MKNKFPSDLLLVVFGPILVTVIALVVGSLIYHAGQWGRGPMVGMIAVICFAYLLFLLRSLKRRSRPSRRSANAHDESTPTI